MSTHLDNAERSYSVTVEGERDDPARLAVAAGGKPKLRAVGVDLDPLTDRDRATAADRMDDDSGQQAA